MAVLGRGGGRESNLEKKSRNGGEKRKEKEGRAVGEREAAVT
jgi:hypothetical protein